MYLQNIYDVMKIEDRLVDSYMLWLQEQGIQDKQKRCGKFEDYPV